jgi:hypothetical protein
MRTISVRLPQDVNVYVYPAMAGTCQCRYDLAAMRKSLRRKMAAVAACPSSRRNFDIFTANWMAERRGAAEMAQLLVIVMCPSERALWVPTVRRCIKIQGAL